VKPYLLGILGVCLVGSCYPEKINNPCLEARVVDVQVGEDETQVEEDLLFYEAVYEAEIKISVESHLNSVYARTTYFRELEKKMGMDELVKWLSYPHDLCLKLAMSYKDNEIPKEEIEKVGKQIRGTYYHLSKKRGFQENIDYMNEGVILDIEEWAKIRIKGFQTLSSARTRVDIQTLKEAKNQGDLETLKKQQKDYICLLYQNLYDDEELKEQNPKEYFQRSRELYETYVNRMNSKEDELRDALKNAVTVGPGGKRAVVKNEIDMISNAAKKETKKSVRRYYKGKDY